MLNAALIALAISAATGPIHTPGFSHGGQRSLATPRLYPEARADSVRRPGFNGRLWVGTITVGPYDVEYATDEGNPGPTAYGAVDHNDRVLARIGTEVVGFSPWGVFGGDGLQRFETARQEWLKEQGYTGGVRTFVNDAYLIGAPVLLTLADEPAPAGTRVIQPRAIIEIAPEVTRFRKRMHVRVLDATTKAERSATARVRVAPEGGDGLLASMP